jgi:diaminopimelate decarboxylase
MRREVLDHVRGLADGDLPAYIYDLADLREHVGAIRAALPERVEMLYAAKANSDPALLRVLGGQVDGFEVSSGGELAHVRGLFPALPIAFGGPGKTRAELYEALAAGVHRLHVESEQELRLLTTVLGDRRIDILLRVNLPVDAGDAALVMGGVPSPFGLDPTRLDACLDAVDADGRLRLRGLHVHHASGLAAPAHLALVEKIVGWSQGWAAARGVNLSEINIGGGMAVDYADPCQRFDWAAFGAGLERLVARHPGLTLRIEPGRSVTVYCGWYVTHVLDVKRSHGEAFAVVRGGTHHLRTPATRQHDQPFQIIRSDTWPWSWERPQARREPVTLTGQLCTPKDVLAYRVPVESLRTGDRVAFAMAGAYAWNISHHDFLMHPAPGFHYLDEVSASAAA